MHRKVSKRLIHIPVSLQILAGVQMLDRRDHALLRGIAALPDRIFKNRRILRRIVALIDQITAAAGAARSSAVLFRLCGVALFLFARCKFFFKFLAVLLADLRRLSAHAHRHFHII